MKTLSILILLLGSQIVADCQITFEKTYKHLAQQETTQSVVEDGNGNYIIATGGKFGSPSLTRDFGLAKLNAYGDTIWYKTFTKGYHPILKEIRKATNAYFVIGQCDDSAQINTYMLWLCKFDTSGNLVWSHNYAGVNFYFEDFGLDFRVLNNSNIFITNGKNLFYILDSNGNVTNFKSYAYYWTDVLEFSKPKLNSNDSTYFFTQLNSPVFPTSPFHPRILKLNQNADTLGSFSVNLDSAWGAAFIVKFINNNYLVLGVVPSVVVANDGRYIFTYLDSLGNRIWRKKINGFNYINVCFSSHAVLKNGNIIISGFTRTSTIAQPSGKAFLYCFNDNGDSLWYKRFSPTDSSAKTEFYDVIATADSGILACGQILFSNGQQKSYIIKLDSNGNLFNPLSLLEKKKENYFHLYPNPASSYTTLHYMGIEKNVILSISNLQGQIIYSQKLQYSDERVIINTSLFSNGFYVCKISSEGKTIANLKLAIAN